MSLTFILILLGVIAVVGANIALLRLSNKPMPVKNKGAVIPPDTAAAPGKTQAAATSALPLTTTSQAEPNKNIAEHHKADATDGSDSGSGCD